MKKNRYHSIAFTDKFLCNSSAVRYSKIPRLTAERTKQIIKNKNTQQCQDNTIAQCNFDTGDILIKREITQNTKLLESMTKIYFTHTAIYIENNIILEAKAFEKNNADEVVLIPIKNTEWTSKKMESWLVVRPNTTEKEKQEIKKIAYKFADSPNIQFGFTDNPEDERNVYCSQLAWVLMKKAGLNLPKTTKKYINPDYLVMVAHTHPQILNIKYASR